MASADDRRCRRNPGIGAIESAIRFGCAMSRDVTSRPGAHVVAHVRAEAEAILQSRRAKWRTTNTDRGGKEMPPARPKIQRNFLDEGSCLSEGERRVRADALHRGSTPMPQRPGSTRGGDSCVRPSRPAQNRVLRWVEQTASTRRTEMACSMSAHPRPCAPSDCPLSVSHTQSVGCVGTRPRRGAAGDRRTPPGCATIHEVGAFRQAQSCRWPAPPHHRLGSRRRFRWFNGFRVRPRPH